MKCSICYGEIDVHKLPSGEVYWSEGHNAQPINNGRCCTACNDTIVILARVNELFNKKEESNAGAK